MSTFYSQGGGGLICEIKLPMQELELQRAGVHNNNMNSAVYSYDHPATATY